MNITLVFYDFIDGDSRAYETRELKNSRLSTLINSNTTLVLV